MKQTAENRAKKLKSILTKLENGENVQNRTLQTWLTDDEYRYFVESWEQQKEIRDELANKPTDIVEYESRLKKAIFTYNKADSLSRKKRRESSQKLFNDAESQFESLLIFLQEIIAADPSLQIWFDRSPTWDIDSELGTNIDSVPRIVTSRSLNCQTGYMGKLSKNEIKQQVVSSALHQLEITKKMNNDIASKKLNILLKKLNQ